MWRAQVVWALGLLLLVSTADAFGSGSIATLRTLTSDFSNARSMPLGSRPSPSAVDLDSLRGLSPSTIRDSLGNPDKYDAGWPPLDCGAPLCWCFTYGPEPAPLDDPVEIPGGTIVSIRTGGPWLLILGFKRGRLVTAFWRGQK